jgi:hypothetical protein
MAKTYRITSALMIGDQTSLILAVFPSYDGWPTVSDQSEITVSVPDSAPAPADLGPLVKVELVTSE